MKNLAIDTKTCIDLSDILKLDNFKGYIYIHHDRISTYHGAYANDVESNCFFLDNNIVIITDNFESDNSLIKGIIFNSQLYSRIIHFVNINVKFSVTFSDKDKSEVYFLGFNYISINKLLENRHLKNRLVFRHTIFKNPQDFSNLKSDETLIFTDCVFEKVPNFQHINFKETPLFHDNVTFPEPKLFEIFRPEEPLLLGSAHARWRILKELAIKGNDFERELNFFASELKTHPKPSIRIYAFLYGLFSDFGRSISRPFTWLMIGMLFNFLVILFSTPPDAQKCKAGDLKYSIVGSSIGLALEKALPLSSLLAPERSKENFLCLYGYRKSQDSNESRKNKYEEEPYIPQAVSFYGTLQTVFSLAMLFFLGLGLRNRFRIKAV